MKSTTYLLALFVSIAVAAPASVKRTEELDTCGVTSGEGTENEAVEDISVLPTLCSLGTALCCSSKATDAKSLECIAPSTAPITIAGLEASCLVTGKKHPRCCVLDVAGHTISCDSSLV